MNSGILRIAGLAGSFNSHMLVSGLSFDVPGNTVINVVNTGNTNGSALFGVLDNTRRTSSNSVMLNRAIGLTSISRFHSDVSGAGAICRRVSRNTRVVGVGGCRVPTQTCYSHFGFHKGSRRGVVNSLSNNRHGQIRLTGLLGANNGMLLLSRPAGSLSIRALQTLRRTLLRFPNYTVIVSRSH